VNMRSIFLAGGLFCDRLHRLFWRMGGDLRENRLTLPDKEGSRTLLRSGEQMFTSIMALAVITMVTGCTRLQQYRTHYTPCDPAKTNACPLEAIEETKDYMLGFIEFDDQGWLWDTNQLRAVVGRFREEERTNGNGLIMVLYTHGWKHNASASDADVKMFREILAGVQAIENSLNPNSPRRAAGIYLGWRGLSLTPWALKNLSFWGRKQTANVVGQGAVAEVLVSFDRIRVESRLKERDRIAKDERPPTMFVVAGHSFGSIVLYSAVASLLQERLTTLGAGTPVTGFADLVALVNPAVEAARVQPLRRSAEYSISSTNRMVSVAICTSKGDLATKYAFPVGRFFSTIMEKHRHRGQHRANLIAVGHYEPFTTHDLRLKTGRSKTPASASSIQESVERIRSIKSQARRQRRVNEALPEEISFSQTILQSRKTQAGSVFLVSVDKSIIPNHGKIDTDEFKTFIREFIMAFGDPKLGGNGSVRE
jgi:hypothetical protein